MRLDPDVWLRMEQRHRERLHPWVSAHLARHEGGQKHPVYDFLFDYYSFSPGALMRWSPGLGVVLDGDAARKFMEDDRYAELDGGIALNPGLLPGHRRAGACWILQLLESTAERPARFGCFGLHEWAMVYRAGPVRHEQVPLRLSRDAIEAFVESQTLCCSHFDAFRFFTPAARPLNSAELTRKGQLANDQGGCLHVNMDLYKWAYKFYPWIPGDLVADAFLLAADTREIDMRASPYDLRSLGFEPILLETDVGRDEYQRLQFDVAQRAKIIRGNLAAAYRRIRDLMPEPQSDMLLQRLE